MQQTVHQPEEDREEEKDQKTSGAGQFKKDVSQLEQGESDTSDERRKRTSLEEQEKRANDPLPAGLTASEEVRYQVLVRRADLNSEETEELRQLNYKRENGLPEAQMMEIIRNATSNQHEPATKKSLKAESSQGREEAAEKTQEDLDETPQK